MKAFSYKMLDSGALEINVMGVIGDGWGPDCTTASQVREAIKSAPDVKLIDVNIESNGGDYFEGLAMYQMLHEHSATVNVHIGANASSAATLVAMAGDTISMHETSTMLVHEVWTIAIGKADALRKKADALDVLSNTSVTAYAARTGMKPEDVMALMKEDRFMTADEALKFGFCTTIRKAKQKPNSKSEIEIRSEIEAMRTHAQASAGAMRIAAMSPPTSTNSHNNISNPHAGQENSTMDLKLILAALGLPETATSEQIAAFAQESKATAAINAKICAALKVTTPDEALGTIAALQSNRENIDSEGHAKILSELGVTSSEEALGTIAALNDAKERLTALESEAANASLQREKDERTAIIAQLRDEGKCTPRHETELFPQLKLSGLKSFAATAVPVLKGDGKRQARSQAAKKWEEMTAVEQRALHDGDPEAFSAAYSEYQSRTQS